MPATLPIELRLNSIGQLFNSLDPSPFHERDLDDDAEIFIVEWASELPSDASLTIRIILPPQEAETARKTGVGDAFCNYFAARAEAARRELTEVFRSGQRYLLFGVPVLAGCLMASQYLRGALEEGPLTEILAESFVILGWVANWRPIEVFLYDWQAPRRRMRLYKRLARAQVEIAGA